MTKSERIALLQADINALRERVERMELAVRGVATMTGTVNKAISKIQPLAWKPNDGQ